LKFSLGEGIVNKSLSSFDEEIADKMSNMLNENTAVVPQRITSLLSVSHRQKPLWKLPTGYNVLIKTVIKKADGSEYFYKNDGEPLKKHLSIYFTAITSIKKPFKVYWQIVNTGDEARNCLRGGFESSDIGEMTKIEGTAYTGSHYIQCFIIKNGQCVGKSKEYFVNIE
ncbi:MAG TPA: hypothetical protein PK733_19730, partial [Clostridiales bacterium]|nr:hypothetical protein [Clostridiales bacterium]